MHHPWRGRQSTSSETGRQSAPPACSACTGCGHSSPQPQNAAAEPRAPASMPSVRRLKSGRLSLPAARCASGRCAQPGLPTAARCRYATPVASLLGPRARPSSKQQLLRLARAHHKRADSGRSGAGRARRAGRTGRGRGGTHLGGHGIQQVPLQLAVLHAGQLVPGVVHQAAHLRA